MAKRVHWYLEGWVHQKEKTPSGRERTVWAYTGSYFAFDVDAKGLRRLKAEYDACIALDVVLWLILSLCEATGRDKAFYVGGPWYISMIPLMFLLIGGLFLLRVPLRMTYRDMYGSYKVILYSAWPLLILHGLSVLGEVVYLYVGRGSYPVGKEILWLIGALFCAALAGIVLRLCCRFPALVIPGKEPPAA